MVVFGMTGGLRGLSVLCFCSVAAFGSGPSLPALSPGLSGAPGLIGVAPCETSDASESPGVRPSLDGRTRLISGLIVRFNPVGSTGAAGFSRDVGTDDIGTGVPQILQKRAPATSSLLHLEQRFISILTHTMFRPGRIFPEVNQAGSSSCTMLYSRTVPGQQATNYYLCL
jgi:hypothetical protein